MVPPCGATISIKGHHNLHSSFQKDDQDDQVHSSFQKDDKDDQVSSPHITTHISFHNVHNSSLILLPGVATSFKQHFRVVQRAALRGALSLHILTPSVRGG